MITWMEPYGEKGREVIIGYKNLAKYVGRSHPYIVTLIKLRGFPRGKPHKLSPDRCLIWEKKDVDEWIELINKQCEVKNV